MKDSTGNGKGGEYRPYDRRKWDEGYDRIKWPKKNAPTEGGALGREETTDSPEVNGLGDSDSPPPSQ